MVLNRKHLSLALLSFGSLASLGSLGVLPACNPGAPAPTRAAASPTRQTPPKQYWSRFAESQSWPTSTADWFPSRGHYGGTSEGLVRVSPPALAAYRELTLGATLEAATILVMLHRSLATGKPGPVHVMERHERGWQYWLLAPDGAIERQGELPLCARCHADAPADGAFGPPAPSEPSATELSVTDSRME